jgi:hypothetical protein
LTPIVANWTLLVSTFACLSRNNSSAWSALPSAETPTVLPARSLMAWMSLAAFGAVTSANNGSRPVAAAEHAAKRVENVATGGFDRARGQIGITRSADMLSQGPSGIVGHHRLPARSN